LCFFSAGGKTTTADINAPIKKLKKILLIPYFTHPDNSMLRKGQFTGSFPLKYYFIFFIKVRGMVHIPMRLFFGVSFWRLSGGRFLPDRWY